jgi:hypothetical protein
VGLTAQEKFKVLPFRVKIKVQTFSGMKTYDLLSGDDGACALLPSWRRRYWRSWISSAVLLMFVLLLREIDNCNRIFSFYIFILFFWLCASVMLLEHYVIAEAECNWYILDINIFSLSKKNVNKYIAMIDE